MIVSSMLVTVAGPVPVGAAAAQEQPQSNKKRVQIDQAVAAKLQKVLKQVAGQQFRTRGDFCSFIK